MNKDVVNVDGYQIRKRRLDRDWGQELFAERSGLGLRTIQKAEASQPIEYKTLEILAATLQCPTIELQPETVRNKHAARQVMDKILNQAQLDLIDEYYAEDFLGHDPTYGAPIVGRNQLRNLIGQLKQAFPDLKHRVEHIVAEDNRVTIRWTLYGTHAGQFSSFAPSKKRFDVEGFSLMEFESGKIREVWQMSNYHDFLAMIGASAPVDKLIPTSSPE